MKMGSSAKTCINLVPEEVIHSIFEKISWSDLLACSQVSKTWFAFVERSNRLRLNISAAAYHLEEKNKLPSSLLRTYRNLRIEIIESGHDGVDFSSPDFQTIMENSWDVKIDVFQSYISLIRVLSLCKDLKSLKICDTDDMEEYPFDKDTEALDLVHISHLRDFRLEKYHGKISFDNLVPKMELRNLEFFNVEVCDKIMQRIIKLSPHLESLELYGIENLTAEAFVFDDGLGAAKRLHTLVLPALAIDDRVVEKMQLPRLRKLWFLKQKDLQTSERAITHTLAKNCPMLMKINGTGGTTRFERDQNSQSFDPVYQDNDTTDPDDSDDDADSDTDDSEGSFGLYKFRNGRFRRLFPPLFCRFRDLGRNRYFDSDMDDEASDEEDENDTETSGAEFDDEIEESDEYDLHQPLKKSKRFL